MNLIDAIAMEYEYEMKQTRKTLERVPDPLLAWKPHTKSFSMGKLASHIAELPQMITGVVSTDSLELATLSPFNGASRDEILKTLDKYVAAALGAMKGVSNEALMKPWSLLLRGTPMMQMPKAAALRTGINHQIHHRGQLTVYLRLNDIPVPALYGPSADEQ